MDPRIQRIIGLLEENLHRQLPSGEITDAVNLSLQHLRCLFRTETGEPLARFQKAIRLREARKLLQDTSLNIKEIRLKVGIMDESHFVRDFKRMYGITPMRYRRQFESPPRFNSHDCNNKIGDNKIGQ
jgi:transcriptional regulator GlxA family with amidase domain